MPGFSGAMSANAQGISTGASPFGVYGYGPNVTASPAFGSQPSAVIVGEMAGVPAPALLAAVAIRRGQPQGPTNDQEVEDFLYDALELLSAGRRGDCLGHSGLE